ncbi:MAG: hypothetical protein NVS3B29_01400 [Candidatus Saccharimonadales bacterium]
MKVPNILHACKKLGNITFIMNPFASLPKPLHQAEFYILLALSRGESMRYPLKTAVWQDSKGAVSLADSPVYRAMRKLHEIGDIDLIRTEDGRAGNLRMEFYDIARHAGIMDDETPTDIQRLRLDLLDGGKG